MDGIDSVIVAEPQDPLQQSHVEAILGVALGALGLVIGYLVWGGRILAL